jgi:two-component system, NarL family, response regulator LiaR
VTSPPPIRVMLVDDHTMVRRGLATFLKVYEDLELVGEAASGEAAISLCARIQPDVVLMDMIMPGMDGATTTQAIRQQFPTVQVIALTSFSDEDLVGRALQAGAIGYLFKDISADELAQAIRAAYARRGTISPAALQMMIRTANRPPVAADHLTAREREVLVLMAEGWNNTEIAEKLTVSPSTIKSHVSNILSKLGVTSRTEAVVLAIRQGMLD